MDPLAFSSASRPTTPSSVKETSFWAVEFLLVSLFFFFYWTTPTMVIVTVPPASRALAAHSESIASTNVKFTDIRAEPLRDRLNVVQMPLNSIYSNFNLMTEEL